MSNLMGLSGNEVQRLIAMAPGSRYAGIEVPGMVVERGSRMEHARASEILRRHQEEEGQHAGGDSEEEESLWTEGAREGADLTRYVLEPSLRSAPEVPQLLPESVEQADVGDLNSNHARIVAVIAFYGRSADGVNGRETWIREFALLVLIYEGVQLGVFQLDYAPKSVRVNHSELVGRVYMNISQEALGAVEDLMEWGLVSKLHMITKQHHMVTSYQLTDKGKNYVSGISSEDMESVRRLVFGPDVRSVGGHGGGVQSVMALAALWKGAHRHLLRRVFLLPHHTSWLQEGIDSDGSGGTASELALRWVPHKLAQDVSYVTSPYIPVSLRAAWGPELPSNKERAAESSTAASNKQSATVEELYLSSVRVLSSGMQEACWGCHESVTAAAQSMCP
eukprot:768733-Hanusia_phi.AAC.5